MNATLRDLVRQAQSDGTSARQLAIKARKRGYKIVGTTISAIAAGTYKSQPTEETIRAIGWLAGVPEEQAFTAARHPAPGPPFAEELPPGVDYLSTKKRKVVIELLRVLVETEQVMGNAKHPAPIGDIEVTAEEVTHEELSSEVDRQQRASQQE